MNNSMKQEKKLESRSSKTEADNVQYAHDLLRDRLNSLQTVPFIDSHFHLMSIMHKGLESSAIFENAWHSHVRVAMDIAINCNDIDLRREMLENAENKGLLEEWPMILGYTIGLYPSFASEDNIDEHLQQLKLELERRRSDPLLWAVGEIGMDFYRNYGTAAKQEYLFRRQVELAQDLSLPIVVHNREADAEIASVLADFQNSAQGTSLGIMHCFSSDARTMEKYLNLGMYISIAGNSTFKNSQTIRETAAEVPADRILFETDSPYLSPVPFRGHTNQPSYVRHTYQCIANIRGINVEDLKKQVFINFARIVPRFLSRVLES